MRTRAGTAIALEAAATARGIARGIAERPDVACGVYELEPGSRAVVQLTLSGQRAGVPILSLDETRDLTVDASGNVRLLRSAEFRSEIGREGRREREWRLVGGTLYTRDQNLPFESRPANVAVAGDLIQQSADVFETLVELTGIRWDVLPGQTGYRLRAVSIDHLLEAVRCGRGSESDPWLSELIGELRLELARADVDYDMPHRPGRPRPRDWHPVHRRGDWAFTGEDPEQDVRLQIRVDEQITWNQVIEPISVPTDVFDIARDRRHQRLSNFLRDLDLRLQ